MKRSRAGAAVVVEEVRDGTGHRPLEAALASNRQLQKALTAELERVVDRQIVNRRQAAALTNELVEFQKQQQQEWAGALACPPLPAIDCERRWSRRFFVDAKGTEPEPNADTLKRREMERTDNYFFHHLRPPWSTTEIKYLKEVIKEQDQHVTEAASTATMRSSQNLDYEQVEAVLKEKCRMTLASSSKAMQLARSAQECRLQHNQIQSKALTKLETKQICQQVTEGKFSAVDASDVVDWEKVAASFSTEQYLRTPFDCLAAFMSALKKTSPWTIQEDEILLKFIAAAGPQAVLESKNALVQHLLVHLLPSKTKQQVFTRANSSLLNPKLKNDRWSEDEERRLAILMKIYHRQQIEDGRSRDLFMPSLHFDRHSQSVLNKWNRSLNPEYSPVRPFTLQEDKRLLSVMRADLSISWADLSRKHFPNRQMQRLLMRWQELATDHDILSRERALLAAKNQDDSTS